ncbi:leukosialin [Lemur catta]|uniref:leukosialin n=1 Tax=Lemur catta TaxID=9447 RepID=UPI001E26DC09|nr:leukosialin [Lemur catta]
MANVRFGTRLSFRSVSPRDDTRGHYCHAGVARGKAEAWRVTWASGYLPRGAERFQHLNNRARCAIRTPGNRLKHPDDNGALVDGRAVTGKGPGPLNDQLQEQGGWGRMQGGVGGARAPLPFPLGPCLPQSCPSLRRSWSGLAPDLCPNQLSRSQLCVCLALEMALLLLFWALVVSPEALGNQTTLQPSSPGGSSLVSRNSEALNLNSVMSISSVTKDPKDDGTGDQVSSPPRTPTASEVSPLGTSTGASTDPPVSEPTVSQEVSPEKSSMLLETSNATSDPAVPTAISHNVTSGIMTASSLETSNGASGPPVTTATSSLETSSGAIGPPVTMATSSLETSNGASGPPVTMATSSLETSSEASGPPVTTATSSLETSNGASGPPVTMATSSLETSNGASGPPVTMATSSLETSSEASGPPVTTATGSLETSNGAGDSSISSVKISTVITPVVMPSPNPHGGSKGVLLVPVLMALLVAVAFIALLLLWRHRQKRRTGALKLSAGRKRNGAVDAWAGPARVPEEGAATATAGGPGEDKGPGVPNGEESGPRPTLTTFFGRRKSRQGSLALEELKPESGPRLGAEEEPLVGSAAGAGEDRTSDGPEARRCS